MNGISLQDGDPAADITAGGAALSGSGIGTSSNPIGTDVANLDVRNTTSGGIFVTDLAGDLTLTDLNEADGAVSGVGGGGEIRASGPLVISASAITSEGMTYTAIDSAARGDDLTVNSNATVQDTTASLTLNGGDNVTVSSGSTVRAAATVTIRGDFGNADAATGASITINGVVTSTLTNISGNADNDSFVVSTAAPQAHGPLMLNGNGGLNTATVNNVVVSGSASDGLNATNLASIDVTDSSFSNNANEGVDLITIGAVSLTRVTSTGNVRGAIVRSAASFSDTDGHYSGNDDHGIRLLDIAGDVTLVRTTAENNDADNDATGDGLSASDGADADLVAIGGNFVVEGGTFRDTDGAGFGVHQERGVFLASIAGDVTFQDSAGPTRSVTVTGHEGTGVRVANGGVNATFTNGTYSNNGAGSQFPGVNLDSFSGTIAFTDVTASGNTDNGIEVNSSGVITLTNVTAENNTTANEGDGAEIVSSTSLTVTGGSFSGNADSGIDVEFVPTLSLMNVAANDNGRDGFTFEGNVATQSAVTVTGGTFSGNVRDGVHMRTVADVTFTPNANAVLSSNGDDGIDIDDFSGTVTLRNLTASGNIDRGFVVANPAQAGVLALNDLTLLTNGLGGDVNNLTTVNFTPTSTADPFDDRVSVSAMGLQENANQTIAYVSVLNLNVNTLAGADAIDVLSTNTTTTTTVSAGDGNDAVNVSDPASGSLDGVAGPVFVNGDAGTADSVTINDRASLSDRTFSVTGASTIRAGGATINYTTIEQLAVNAGAGSDTFTVTPDATVEISVAGELPAAPNSPGDSLKVIVAGTTIQQHDALSADSGRYTFDDRQPVNHTGIETYIGPNLRMAKGDGDADADAVPGGMVAYTLNYTNAGNQDAAGVVISDTVPANATFNPVASDVGWVCVPNDDAGSVCTFTVGAVAMGSGGLVTFSVTIANPLPLGLGSITNTARIVDDGTSGADQDLADNSDTETTPVPFDFGDAPDSVDTPPSTYPTLLASDGAWQIVSTPLRLGTIVDFEPDGQPNTSATGDDSNGVHDEDGVALPATLVARLGAMATVTASLAGCLDAWIDFNRDGDWNDAGEQIATSLPLVAGANSVSFAVPDTALDGTSFARFRLSSAGGLAPTGPAADGEVEDYSVRIVVYPESSATLIADPLNPGQKLLLALGSSVTDKLSFKATSRGSLIDVKLGPRVLGSFDAGQVGRIVAFGLAGNDSITVNANVTSETQLHGGDGNDSIHGGGGNTIVLGGANNDVLRGGRNRNLLIGGPGLDRLTGGSDIVIGGTTDYDAQDQALTAIMMEWKSARSYNDRVARLRAGTGVPELDAMTIFDDLLANQLVGGRGLDWFFQDDNDRISGRSPDEFQDAI